MIMVNTQDIKKNTDDLVTAEKQSQWFKNVRESHKTEVAEDYVELIADLMHLNGEVRTTDLARRFGVSSVTVNKVIVRLQEKGLATSEPYRSIFLTPAGKDLAKKCKKRHQIILNYLISIGVSPETAQFDAEGIEHHISEETLNLFEKILNDSKINSWRIKYV